MSLKGTLHIGRSWKPHHDIEDKCPCGKAPCGLVDSTKINDDCPQHGARFAQTMRQMHSADLCPGKGKT